MTNYNPIHRLRPDKVLIYGLVFYLVMFFIAPVSIKKTITISSASYLILCLFFFYRGCKHNMNVKDSTFTMDSVIFFQIYNVVFVLSIITVVLKYVDWFFVRGFSVGLDSFADNMLSSEEHQTSVISLLSALVACVPYIPVTLNMIFPIYNGKKAKFIAFVLFFMTAVGSIVTGSRFALINPLLFLTFIWVSLNKNRIFTIKRLIIGFIATFLFLFFSSALFIERLGTQGREIYQALSYEGYSDKVPASTEFERFLNEHSNDAIQGPAFAFVQSTQYAIHGPVEFPICKQYIDKHGFCTYGSSTFFVINKFFNFIGMGISSECIESCNTRPGIWSTFFYNWYLDFNWLGVPLIFLLGMFCSYSWEKTAKGNFFFLPLTGYLSIIIILMLQLNCIAGTASYALFDFIIFALWATKKMNKGLEK